MPLFLEHPEAERLARVLAKTTGETLTDAVLNALRERLQRETTIREPALRDDLRRIQRRFISGRRECSGPRDEIIGYDEHGLPT